MYIQLKSPKHSAMATGQLSSVPPEIILYILDAYESSADALKLTSIYYAIFQLGHDHAIDLR